MDTNAISEDVVKMMLKKGILFGHKKSKTHPKMREYIAGNRNEIELLNPESVWESLASALAFCREKSKEGALVLFVGTTPPAQEVIEKTAKELDSPYVTSRWLGGTLTNFSIIRKRVKYYEDLMEKREKGEFERYTKKERHDFIQEIEKLSRTFEGLRNLTRVPDIVFIVDTEEHETAVREANKLNIPIVGIVNTNADPSVVRVPIFASDHSRDGIAWILEKVSEEFKAGRDQGEREKETQEKHE